LVWEQIYTDCGSGGTLFLDRVWLWLFRLGPVRVFWLEPRLGKMIATLCEAATAISHDFTSVTRNTRDVELPGAPIVDPLRVR
jgi:hypothetical protein